MGTNYYLRPKGFDKIEEVTSEVYKDIDYARIEYIKALGKIIEEAKKISPIYSDLLHLPTEEDLNQINIELQYEYDLPEIHICKVSGGWVPSFEANKYYKSFKEFEAFYSANKSFFDIYDEYDREVDFSDFKKMLFDWLNDDLLSHSKYYPGHASIRYWRDDSGFDWIDSEFS